MRAYEDDVELLTQLGLATDFGYAIDRDGFVDIGTARLGERAPGVTVKVEVAAMPAQFWRFTIRGRAEGPDVEVTTGSGSFSDFWPSVALVAQDCLVVTTVDDGA